MAEREEWQNGGEGKAWGNIDSDIEVIIELERGKGYALERKWQRDTTMARESLGVSSTFAPWTSMGAKSLPLSFLREREVIELGMVYRLKAGSFKCMATAAKDWYADVSQGVGNFPYGHLHTLCTGLFGK